MKKLKTLTALILILIFAFSIPCYSEETDINTDKLSEDLASENKDVREDAIDRLVTQVIEKLETVVNKYEYDEEGEYTKHDKRIRAAMLEAFENFTKKPKEEVKETLNQALEDDEARDLIAPFMGVFLEILNEKIDQEIDEALNKNNSDMENTTADDKIDKENTGTENKTDKE